MEKHELERFYHSVDKLIKRVEELEEKIVIHAFEGVVSTPHPHNIKLLKECRINMTEASGTWRGVLEKRESFKRKRFNNIII